MPVAQSGADSTVHQSEPQPTAALAEQVQNLQPEQLRKLAQILLEMMRREMRVEQERYRRDLYR